MPIVQISQIKHRRGLQENLPQLGSAELGWSIDAQRLFIGSGTREEGAPTEENIEILTESSPAWLRLLEATGPSNYYQRLEAGNNSLASAISIVDSIFSDTNTRVGYRPTIMIRYQIDRDDNSRTGILKVAKSSGSTISYEDDYAESGDLGITISVDDSGSGSSSLNINLSLTSGNDAYIAYEVDAYSKTEV